MRHCKKYYLIQCLYKFPDKKSEQIQKYSDNGQKLSNVNHNFRYWVCSVITVRVQEHNAIGVHSHTTCNKIQIIGLWPSHASQCLHKYLSLCNVYIAINNTNSGPLGGAHEPKRMLGSVMENWPWATKVVNWNFLLPGQFVLAVKC